MRTDVNVYPMNDKGNLKAMCSVTIAGHFVVSGIRLLDSERFGLYIKMPSYRTQEYDEYGRQVYKEYVVMGKELYAQVKEQIVNAYQNILAGYDQDQVRPEDLAYPTPTIEVTRIDRDDSPAKARQGEVSVGIGGGLFVNGIRVIKGKSGTLFLGMPSYSAGKFDGNGQLIYNDVCFPVTKEMRTKLNQVILNRFVEDKEWDVQPDDYVVEIRTTDGSTYYWIVTNQHTEGQEMQHNLYTQDFRKIASAPFSVRVDDFIKENIPDVLPGLHAFKANELEPLKRLRDKSLTGGAGYTGVLSDAEKSESINTVYYRLSTGRIFSTHPFPYGKQAELVCYDEMLHPERVVDITYQGDAPKSDELMPALQSIGLPADYTAIPTASFFAERSRLNQLLTKQEHQNMEHQETFTGKENRK